MCYRFARAVCIADDVVQLFTCRGFCDLSDCFTVSVCHVIILVIVLGEMLELTMICKLPYALLRLLVLKYPPYPT